MNEPIKRGVPWPSPYGRELPLPSDLKKDSHEEVVLTLQVLWVLVAEEKLPREEQDGIINSFFEKVSEDKEDWLEEEDPRWRKPRGILVKQSALQISQRGRLAVEEFLTELKEKHPEVLSAAKEFLEQAQEDEIEEIKG